MEISEKHRCFYSFPVAGYDVCVAEDRVFFDDGSDLYVGGVWHSDEPDGFSIYILEDSLFYKCILKEDRPYVLGILKNMDLVNLYPHKMSLFDKIAVVNDVRLGICSFLMSQRKYSYKYDLDSFKELYGINDFYKMLDID